MKTISVTEFKAHCLELLNEVAATGEPITLTKRGKPTAMVVPPGLEQAKSKWVPGKHRDTATILGDVVAPLEESWEALT